MLPFHPVSKASGGGGEAEYPMVLQQDNFREKSKKPVEYNRLVGAYHVPKNCAFP